MTGDLTRDICYQALRILRDTSEGRVVLGDLVRATPCPEGFSGRLPASLEVAWYALLRGYLDEYEIEPPVLLERMERAGRYLAAGGMAWAFRGASGLALPSLCLQSRSKLDLFRRLMTESAGPPMQEGGQGKGGFAPSSIADPEMRERWDKGD